MCHVRARFVIMARFLHNKQHTCTHLSCPEIKFPSSDRSSSKMDSQYAWKEPTQIDPSFVRSPTSEFSRAPENDQPAAVSPKDDKSPAEQPREKPARRSVSNTKRAAQNRNAQKAFRQRREKYVKELEATAAEVAELHKTIEELRQENLQLRDYTLALQSRLIELSPNVAVAHPLAQEFNKL